MIQDCPGSSSSVNERRHFLERESGQLREPAARLQAMKGELPSTGFAASFSHRSEIWAIGN